MDEGYLWSDSAEIASGSTKVRKKQDTRNATENEDSFNLSYPMALRFHAPLIFFGASDDLVWPNFSISGQPDLVMRGCSYQLLIPWSDSDGPHMQNDDIHTGTLSIFDSTA